MKAHLDGCKFTCGRKAQLTVHRKAVHGLPPETSKTAKVQSKKTQEQNNQNVAPSVGTATSGTKSAPSSKESVKIGVPLPKLTIKFKIPHNRKA